MTEALQSGLATPVRFVKGVGETRAQQLAKLGIETVGDLLLSLPNRYEDRREIRPMAEAQPSEFCVLQGRVLTSGWVQPRFGKGFFEAAVSDGTGVVRCRWFSATWMKDLLKKGEALIVFGKLHRQKSELVLRHPDYELVADEEGGGTASIHLGRIVPVYALTEDLPQKTMRRIAWAAVERYAGEAVEALPEETLKRFGLPGIVDALREVHFPASLRGAVQARERLVFEEFLCMQLVLVARKIQTERKIQGIVHRAPGEMRRKFIASLPFALTGAQQRCLEEIRKDMELPAPMHRLLQGDVGSGKTVVAACAILDALECGSQAAIMAPTEILAGQHFKTFSRYLEPLGVKLALLSGSLQDRQKEQVREGAAAGRIHLVVGTHALIQERVMFRRLGVAVIDEQHKFGVEQRGLLYDKGVHPDVLVMTATPIPRTLAMTLYGDLDVSVIDEMPAGRQVIVTRVIKESQLELAYGFIRKQVAKGRQAYLVYPLVAESEMLDLKSAEVMYAQLRQGALKEIPMGLLHGQMNSEAKERVMRDFREGRVSVLVATTVVEVGVDVPNATVMLVENAERFGLSQLHQLRGRIGRGSEKSFCILQASPAGLDAWKRLKIMEETTDGFRIAEEDFKIRGMGNVLGREQSGAPLLKVGDPLADVAVLEKARQEAFRLVETDPDFVLPAYEPLRQRARSLYRMAGAFIKVG